jgi:hypothetical protein
MSPEPSAPGQAGQNEQEKPYEGKHRAPESKFKRLELSEANTVLDQPASAPHPMPDAPGHTAAEVRCE